MSVETAPLLFVALALDAAFGEPERIWSRLPHPAVLFGRLIDICDRRFNHAPHARRNGILTMAVLSLGAVGLGLLVVRLPLGEVWSILLAAILLAQKSLSQHVLAVADALRSSLPEGRRAVSMIVGRDTAEMAPADISRAAIESAAENLSDGVVAPAFWFLVAGLPGLLLYKIVNTADSMIGHKTPRHAAFGWAAARFDDLLNWVPARLTAGLIALSHRSAGALSLAWTEARQHRSPNAGWPEAAMAGVLDVALSGPRSYGGVATDEPFVNAAGDRKPGPLDIEAAAGTLWRVWLLLLALAGLLTLL